MTALSARVTKPHESHLEAEERRQTENVSRLWTLEAVIKCSQGNWSKGAEGTR